jgi:sigma-E factor negative regulatory protein RseC
MIEQTGVVIAEEGEYVWVETHRQSACGQCENSTGCGTGALSKALGRKNVYVKVFNSKGARKHQQVRLGLHEQALLRGSLWVYTMPLLLMFAASGLYIALAEQVYEPYSALAGLLGLASGFVWLKWQSQKMSRNTQYQPILLD